MTITANDPLCQDIRAGLLDEVCGVYIDADGVPRRCKGGYIIVDGGYSDESWLMDPFGIGCSLEEKRYSEWVESVRKDIECAFGILKARFRLFLNPIQLHRFADIEFAWKAAIMIHNLLITYDGSDISDWERNLDWVNISPDVDDSVFQEQIRIDDFITEDSASAGSRIRMRPIMRDTTPVGRSFTANNSIEYSMRKKMLVTNFNQMFLLSLVKWPCRTNIGLRYRMRIPKMNKKQAVNTRKGLYVKTSNFVTSSGKESIGQGLFSNLNFKKGDAIAVFRGVIISATELDVETEQGRGGYAILLRNKAVRNEAGEIIERLIDRRLQCYDHRHDGRCLGSVANSAYNCIDVTTGRNAVNNCRIHVNERTDFVTLRCYNSFISAHTELAWNYEDDYVFP
jgi:hypothetical protein